MNRKTLMKLLAFSAAVAYTAPPAFADEGQCRHVGGGILRNLCKSHRPVIVV
jgi:hypothetical protein